MGTYTRLSWALATAGLLVAVACRKHESVAGAPPSSAVAASSVVASASARAPQPRPASPLVGVWSGKYQAVHHLIEMDKKEAFGAWAKDKKEVGTGPGKLDLTIDSNGAVTGTSTGALGPLLVSGRLEDGWIRVTLSPQNPAAEDGFHGVVTGKLEGAQIKGSLAVSSADGALVRQGAVELDRAK